MSSSLLRAVSGLDVLASLQLTLQSHHTVEICCYGL